MRIVRTTVAEATAKALREMIVAGDLRAGDALRQEELAAKLGVSRTPLREAIARLDSEGLVVNDPHKGAVVYRPTLEEALEGFEIQSALEPLAGGLAAQHRTDADLVEIRALLRRLDDAEVADEWSNDNAKFHLRIYRMARRPRLFDLIAKQYERSNVFVRMLAMDVEGKDLVRSAREHTAMVKALEKKDAAKMEQLLRDHVNGTMEFVRNQYEQRARSAERSSTTRGR
ncbi:Transcriptional regulator, GntR family [Labilithrix luteola]|uniref:Transcriptional regulator, GntR family n=2 Tax=Labilithrix luteola TaxID=1391654 RepID=A0A0K1Q4W4_9BACT|nr:Transcriptional regulator, GntR family [Labilithrix luteola]